ncbi:MAG: hypothetical protein DHS20C01_17510 [marine bacterium B5-7]|nr:MAG: hypothetical protein DHS20C01_17510 [marine bacterium B5-7]
MQIESVTDFLSRLSNSAGVVLLYHATFARVPSSLAKGLHNIRPEILRTQIEGLARYFKFIDVDEFAILDDPRGYAAVSFDDGYRCIFDEALPIFEELNIPITVYLNGINFAGGSFWRDKVRLVENHGWTSEFERFSDAFKSVSGKRFYRYSKNPAINSRIIDQELDRFIAHKGGIDTRVTACVDNIDDLPRHPLVGYGNHSQHHYVLSSLDATEQHLEITATDDLLERIENAHISKLFSVPFGDVGDFNEETVRILKDANYNHVLMSRGHAHRGNHSVHGITAVERCMPADTIVDLGLGALRTNKHHYG